MADTLALEKLYADVKTQFLLDGTIADQPFGWRTTPQQADVPRITWRPGDPSGQLGRMAPPRNPGRNPRPLGTLIELFTCVISAQDPGDPENEQAQYKATRLLFDAWYRAVYLSSFGTFTIERTDWLIEKTERRFGAAIQAVCTVQSMIPDGALEGVPLDTSARLTTSELDVTETQTVVADPTVETLNEDPQ